MKERTTKACWYFLAPSVNVCLVRISPFLLASFWVATVDYLPKSSEQESPLLLFILNFSTNLCADWVLENPAQI